jgi:hypothetical protein
MSSGFKPRTPDYNVKNVFTVAHGVSLSSLL